MSNKQNTQYIESAWTDFLQFLEEKKFDQCRVIQDAVEELGFKTDALRMKEFILTAQMKKLTVKDNNECTQCENTGKYEVMHLGHDGEPQYYDNGCLHEELEVNVQRV